jgi:hypothetical protein
MTLDNIALDYSYLAGNSKTSYPALGIPNFTETPDGDSEFRAICGLSFQGRGVTDGTSILSACIKGFGSALGTTALPSPSTLTESAVQGYSETGKGLVRFVLSDTQGSELLDTNDITNKNSGSPALSRSTGWRREEILRGEYVHGFAQKDSYFLTYIIHYPTFYEFFSSTGYYSSFTDRLAEYYTSTNQLSETRLAPNTLSPQADNLQSLLAIDIYEAMPEEAIPSFDSITDTAISGELASMFSDPGDHYQNIIFCKNDPAGVQGLGSEYTPPYLSGISGDVNCPWAISDTDTEIYTYLTSDYRDDVLLSEGFNVDIETNSPVLTFNAFAGAGAGLGPDCEDDDTQQPDAVVRHLNNVGPDDVGNVYIGGDKCIMVGPDTDSGAIESNQDDTGTPIHSYRMFSGNPGVFNGINTLVNPDLMISGFCSQCCPCNQYENVHRALEKVAAPLWEINNTPLSSPWSNAGLLHKANATAISYQCVLNQYNDIYECFKDHPAVVSAAGWGHYGYLVSAQVLIQNHGESPLTGSLEVEFDFDAKVVYVENTSYANLDEDNIDDDDFNPAQPLESLGVTIDDDPGSSKITLSGGFLDLRGGRQIDRGRYMLIGVVGYLQTLAETDACEAGESTKTLTAKVSNMRNADGLIANNSDSNFYECLSTLFLDTPCTPPIISVMWVQDGSLYIKFTDPFEAATSIATTIAHEYDWEDWVPGNDGLDVCGNTISYEAPHGQAGSSMSHTFTFAAESDTDSVELTSLGLPTGGLPDDMWGEDVADSIEIYCTCDDCNPDEGSPANCEDCAYPAYASSIQFTLNSTGNPTYTCAGETHALDPIEDFGTSINATKQPPTVFYHCDESAGATCREPGGG